MFKYQNYVNKLKKYGFRTESQNLSDFWFSNKHNISLELFGNTGDDDIFSLIVRWHSEIGIKCSTALREYINNKQNEHIGIVNRNNRLGYHDNSKCKIDFNEFSFFHENENEKINLQIFSSKFETSSISGASDLRGINFSGIQIHNTILKNGFAASSDFSNSNFQQLSFENMNFVSANFYNSRFVNIIIDSSSRIGNVNFANAFLNTLVLNDAMLGDGIRLNEICYFNLIMKPFQIAKLDRKRNCTEISFVDTNSLLDYKLHDMKLYMQWYMNLFNKLNDSNMNFFSKVSLVIQIIISKYWSSYTVFAAFISSIILFLALYFQYTSSNFSIPDALKPVSYIESVYFVVVTFTTLGFGDITPINSSGQLFVIITTLAGYLSLGILISLLGKHFISN